MGSEVDEVARICREAALPVHDLVIAGEGNVSLTTSDDELFVSVTGARLGELSAGDLISVQRSAIVSAVSVDHSDDAWRQLVAGSSRSGRPTVEVGIHSVLSSALGAGVIVHTHPASVLAVMASGRSDQLAHRRLLPDQVVMCGGDSWVLPYIDPGRPLAAALAERIGGGDPVPPVILLENHGIVVSAPTARAALDITLMVSKCARIILGCVGEPKVLDEQEVARIAAREDEKHRQMVLGLVRAATAESP